jgi:hypothetical protein
VGGDAYTERGGREGGSSAAVDWPAADGQKPHEQGARNARAGSSSTAADWVRQAGTNVLLGHQRTRGQRAVQRQVLGCVCLFF